MEYWKRTIKNICEKIQILGCKYFINFRLYINKMLKKIAICIWRGFLKNTIKSLKKYVQRTIWFWFWSKKKLKLLISKNFDRLKLLIFTNFNKLKLWGNKNYNNALQYILYDLPMDFFKTNACLNNFFFKQTKIIWRKWKRWLRKHKK